MTKTEFRLSVIFVQVTQQNYQIKSKFITKDIPVAPVS